MMLICQVEILTTRPAYYGQDVLTDRPENILRIGPQDSAFFVDECGHEEFADGDYPVFGSGGCAAMAANIELAIRISRTTMKSECFGDENVPLHASDLFDRFTQADATDTRQKGGTDLELNISSVTVGQHGGAIGADSVPCSTSKKLEIGCCDCFISGSIGKGRRMDTSDDSDKSAESATYASFRDTSVSVLLKFCDVYHANYSHGT